MLKIFYILNVLNLFIKKQNHIHKHWVLVFLLVFCFTNAFGEDGKEIDKKTNSSNEINLSSLQIKNNKIIKIQNNLIKINSKLGKIEWVAKYNNYITYKRSETALDDLIKKQKRYSKWKGTKYQELSDRLLNTIKIKKNELELLKEYKNSPIGSAINPKKTKQAELITNPFGIITSLSYISDLKKARDEHSMLALSLADVIVILKNESSQYSEYVKLTTNSTIKKQNDFVKLRLKDFMSIVSIVISTDKVYGKKIEQLIQETNISITEQIEQTFEVVINLIVVLVLAFLAKKVLLVYIRDRDNVFSANKVVNFIAIMIIIFIILFSYVNNVSYLVTFLGFASAGIAIALKDWFMSIFGWMVIVSSGSMHTGDRIKVQKNGMEIVGDVLDISMFKISVKEDVTYTSYAKNRRAGRVFFIPNNYIFTDTISNYTFDSLTTVWDGIDFYLTFECNIDKAVLIAKKIATTHAKEYTDIARHNVRMLQKHYIAKQTNTEPRIFTFIEPYGVCLSIWYQTSSYATLPLRSTISMAILKEFQKDKEIIIAYPTQVLKVSKQSRAEEAELLLPGTTASGFFDGP